MDLLYFLSPDFLDKTLGIIDPNELNGVYISNLYIRGNVLELLNRYEYNFFKLIDILKEYPEDEWEWEYISENPNIKMEDITNNPGLPWYWYKIDKNPNITLDFIIDNMDEDWDWYSICKNLNITIDFINEVSDTQHFLDSNQENWRTIIQNLNIKIQDIINNPNKPWYWNQIINKSWYLEIMGENPGQDINMKNYEYQYLISTNTRIKMEDIINNPDKPWAWNLLSQNKGIKIEDVINNSDLPWDWKEISKRDDITGDIVINNSSLPWDWYSVSRISTITIDDIINNYELPWNWYWITYNPSITFNDIISNLELPWDWRSVSEKPNIKLEYIINNLELPWDWDNISENPSIKMKDIVNNPKLPWNWSNVIFNPTLSFNFVKSNLEKKILHNKIPKESWSDISANVTMGDIINNPNKPWDFSHISMNPNLTLSFLFKYLNLDHKNQVFPNSVKDWNFYELSEHEFGYELM